MGWLFKPKNMKTAMQELMDWTIDEQFPVNKQFTDKVFELLEKEKEQIMRDFKNGYKSHPFMCEEYYNQTYNQKHHIIDIMKADEDDGLYNQKK